MIMTKEKSRLEVQTLLIHLTDQQDKEDLIALFHGAGRWFCEEGSENERLAAKACELEEYVENEIHGPLGTMLPAEPE